MLLSSLWQRATPENPSFNINSEAAWDALDAGDPADTGESVSAARAMTYSPWWRGVNLISSGVAKLPLLTYKRTDGGKERATDHPAYHLLRRQPNEAQTAYDFKRLLTSHVLTRGNGYAYIYRRGDGRPTELLPLDPTTVDPVRADGVLWYVVSTGGERRRVPHTDMLHVKGLGYDGLEGYSVVSLARQDLGLGIAARKYQATQFKVGGRPPVVLETPQRLDGKAVQELRESWERMHGGVDNAHRTAILQAGLTAKTLSFSNDDAQLLESMEHNVRDVANWLGLAPHKLGDTTRTAYASLEQENQSFLDEGLDPWLVTWEEECWAKLLTEAEKRTDTHVVEFLRLALVRADQAARSAFYAQALQSGWMSRDEVRDRENLNPIPGGQGQTYFLPLNLDVTGGEPAAVNGGTVADLVAALTAGAAGTIPADALSVVLTAAFPDIPPADIASAVAAVQEAAPGGDEGGTGGVVQDTALNGAQILSLLAIAEKQSLGQISAGAAKALIQASFPAIPPELIESLVAELTSFTPKPLPEPPPKPGTTPAASPDPASVRRVALEGITRRILDEALRRMVRRIGHDAARAAKQPAKFMGWLDAIDGEHRDVVAEALSAPLEALGAVGGRSVASSSDAAGRLLDTLRTDLLDAAGRARPRELVQVVADLAASWETPAWLSRYDPSQPRNPDGTFGSGGAKPAPDAGKLAAAPKEQISGIAVQKASVDGKEYVLKSKPWDSNAKTREGAEIEQTVSELAADAGVACAGAWAMKVGHNETCVSEYVKGRDLKDMSQDERRAALANVPEGQVARQALFDYAVGYKDSHNGNYKIDNGGNLVGFDKEFSLSSRGSYGTEWRVPAFAHDVGAVGANPLSMSLPKGEVKRMAEKADGMAKTLREKGKGKDADYVGARAGVLKKLAEIDAPTGHDLARLASEAAPSGGLVKSLFKKLGF